MIQILLLIRVLGKPHSDKVSNQKEKNKNNPMKFQKKSAIFGNDKKQSNCLPPKAKQFSCDKTKLLNQKRKNETCSCWIWFYGNDPYNQHFEESESPIVGDCG
jgi:hypothetical protein